MGLDGKKFGNSNASIFGVKVTLGMVMDIVQTPLHFAMQRHASKTVKSFQSCNVSLLLTASHGKGVLTTQHSDIFHRGYSKRNIEKTWH